MCGLPPSSTLSEEGRRQCPLGQEAANASLRAFHLGSGSGIVQYLERRVTITSFDGPLLYSEWPEKPICPVGRELAHH
jgi:hypothetical protein